MGLCGSRRFLLRELFIFCGDDFEEGIAGLGANNGDALWGHFVAHEHLGGVGSVGPAGAENVGVGSGVGPTWAAAWGEVWPDF